MRLARFCLAAFLLVAVAASAQQLPSRKMDDLNWMDFRELVPAKIKTVLLTTGTLEPHGVTANGADNLAPMKIAEAIAPEVNALIAPNISYGITGSMSPYPGATQIPPEAYGPYLRAVLLGFVRNGFRNLVIINGHGGPQSEVLNRVSAEVAMENHVNTLMINWWSTCSDAAVQVFGNTGGHAGENETAFIQAIDPTLVHKERLAQVTTTNSPPAGTWTAWPSPSTIGLYRPDVGAPGDFDQKKAEEYFQRVNACVANVVKDTVKKWAVAGFE